MPSHRENRGFHVDALARVVRKSLLNEYFVLPLAAAAYWATRDKSSRDDFAKLLKLIKLPAVELAQVARAALYLGLSGAAFSLNDFLTKWTANNWARNRPGEWKDWSKEIVVVTGGSSGIGENIVKGLLARDPRTTIVIIDFAPISWIVPGHGAGNNKNVYYYQADLSKPDVIKDVCAKIRKEVGHPTVLVNNAGIARGFSVLEGSFADVEVTLKTNLTAPFLLIKEFLPEMVKNDHGHIVNVCSMSAVVAPPGIVDYAASKAGVQALHEGLALELRHWHNAPRVRLTNGMFNFIRTPLLQGQPRQPQFFAPLLHVETVAESIVDALYSGYGKVIYLPGIMRYIISLDPEIPYTQFIVLGTGISGIALGVTLARWYGITSSSSILLFDRSTQLGGTWHWNNYPGAACDVPSALYSFSFERNPDWTRFLPPAAELRAYLTNVANKYDLTRKMRFGREVYKVEWVESKKRWRVYWRSVDGNDGKDGKEGGVNECQFLFSGVGHFTTPNALEIPGVEKFQGEIVHSARWRDDIALKGKRVVLFGNGCTAAQIAPSIVGEVKSLTQVARSKHWVYPPVDSKVPEIGKAILRNLPGATMLQRYIIYFVAELDFVGFGLTKKGERFRKSKQKEVDAYMRSAAPEKYHDLLIPDFEIGCKRRIFDSGYLKSLHAEKMKLTTEKVVEVLPNGVKFESGEVVEADVLILANGFKTNTYLQGIEVIGRNGETMDKHWESFGGPEAYNLTSLSGFPNFFLLLGPNSSTGHTSNVMAIENAVNYGLRVIKPILEGKASVAEVKRSAEQSYAKRIQDALQKTVWTTGCNSWYIRGEGGKIWNGMTYPWAQSRYWYDCLFPVWEDWEFSGPASGYPSSNPGYEIDRE
ncbi:Baeyer-Villiger monooxygenase [Cladorrhinum sp. PSN259]|nr:Baeyer-Villiger monooxygenase [Cladorrhinum sp. PSN259]